MKAIYYFIIILGCICNLHKTKAQFYSTGSAPASIKWSKLESGNFTLIFPRGLDQYATEAASKLENALVPTQKYFTVALKKSFPVILYPTSVLSNGYVTLAPRRMELITTPPQETYAQNWLSQLSLHEVRHMVQLNEINQGFTGAMQWITGQIAPGIVAAQIPSWYFEGDAVYNETFLSATGRGRLAGFEMPLRTLLLENNTIYSYSKSLFGSYKNYVPDAYRYGLPLVEYGICNYGNKVWSHAIDYSARHPFLIWPFSIYLKKTTGYAKAGYYFKVMTELNNKYYKQKDTITSSINYTKWPVRSKVFTSYTLPMEFESDKAICFKKGLDDPGSLVVVDSSGKEKRICRAVPFEGIKLDRYEDLLIWNEILPQSRWEQQSYSVIKQINLKSGKKSILGSRKSRYFSPDISPDGRKIAVIEIDETNKNKLTILDAERGTVIQSFENQFELKCPEWINNHEIAVISVLEDGKRIEIVDVNYNQWKIVLPATVCNIADIVKYKKYILFRASFKGIDNIFAIPLMNSDSIYQVTYSRFGAYYPSISADSLQLIFSDYTVNGFRIARQDFLEYQWKQVLFPFINNSKSALNKNLDTNYSIQPYSKVSHLFNLHSWLPFAINVKEVREHPGDISITPGLTLFSQNNLSTLTSSIAYSYDGKYHKLIPTLSWNGWFPVIEFSGEWGGVERFYVSSRSEILPHQRNLYKEFKITTYIPLLYNRSGSRTFIQPQLEYEYAFIGYNDNNRMHYGIDFLHVKLFVSNYRYLSVRDIYPRFGQSMALSYTRTIQSGPLFGKLFSARSILYFPGVGRNHHLFSHLGFQIQKPERYYIPLNRVDFPRGYTDRIARIFFSVLSNYTFPVAYPDLSISSLLYLKRIRLNAYYDWSYGVDIKEVTKNSPHNYNGNYTSFGIEILADTHFLRILFPFVVGFRWGRLPEKNQYFSEFLLNMNTGVF